jgi:phytoene synthase
MAPNPSPTAAEITTASKSNLALAFVALPREKRDDISVFYAYCRVIDDIADEPGIEPADRRARFDLWKRALAGPTLGECSLAAVVRALIAKYRLDPELFFEIIAGCEMDVAGGGYAAWEDLRLYCYRVASVVGLVSIEIFGYRDPACKEYAIQLGLALQVTNIIRDVGADFENDGRIYLPRDEMERFGVTAEDLAARRHSDAFLALIQFQAERAEGLYRAAIAVLPPRDRRAMIAAEIMRTVYSTLLRKMRRDGFRVLERRYRLNKLQKMLCVAQALARNGR